MKVKTFRSAEKIFFGRTHFWVDSAHFWVQTLSHALTKAPTKGAKMKISNETKQAINHITSEANSPKSDLIALLRELESLPGTKGAAKSLSDIIGRLESWQAKFSA